MTVALDVLSAFDIRPDDYICISEKNGLINKSYKVKDSSGTNRYFLQQIDHDIFKDVIGLMKNIEQTINHLQKTNDVAHLNLIALKENNGYLYLDSSSYWRLYEFVPGKTYFRATNERMALEAGKGYGDFLKAIAGLNHEDYVETIPRFHDLVLRLEQFEASHKNASKERLETAKDQLSFVDSERRQLQDYYEELVAISRKQVTHNDTKLSNLLFDDDSKAKLVVDYDTLMPGYYALDYGDSIRTLCSTTEEDSDEIETTEYIAEFIEAFTQEFLKRISGELNDKELQLFPMAICYMPFLMGLRMLTDYLNNDVYYSTSYPEHNLVRAKNQFALYASGVSFQDHLNNIVSNYTR